MLPLITDSAPDRVAAAQEIVRQWSPLGVKVQVETLDGPILRQRLADHNFTLALWLSAKIAGAFALVCSVPRSLIHDGRSVAFYPI